MAALILVSIWFNWFPGYWNREPTNLTGGFYPPSVDMPSFVFVIAFISFVIGMVVLSIRDEKNEYGKG